MTALAIAALAEAAAPYGIESFDDVLKPLWLGIRQHRGKGLAAFLKAIGFIIPLMDPDFANYYTKDVTVILIREFQTSDEGMKKTVLKVVKQCAGAEGVTPGCIKADILPDFFKSFWVRRMALDRRNYKQVVETTVELAQKAGVSEIVGRIVNDLKVCGSPFYILIRINPFTRMTQSRIERWSWRRSKMSFRHLALQTLTKDWRKGCLTALSMHSRNRLPKIKSCSMGLVSS
jgi:hypothetical protein